jgi:hypothetical protein
LHVREAWQLAKCKSALFGRCNAPSVVIAAPSSRLESFHNLDADSVDH